MYPKGTSIHKSKCIKIFNISWTLVIVTASSWNYQMKFLEWANESVPLHLNVALLWTVFAITGILSTVERNIDKSPEIVIVSLGLDDITGPLSDNVDVVNTVPDVQSNTVDVTNHIGNFSSHNRGEITETDTTPKHTRIRKYWYQEWMYMI